MEALAHSPCLRPLFLGDAEVEEELQGAFFSAHQALTQRSEAELLSGIDEEPETTRAAGCDWDLPRRVARWLAGLPADARVASLGFGRASQTEPFVTVYLTLGTKDRSSGSGKNEKER